MHRDTATMAVGWPVRPRRRERELHEGDVPVIASARPTDRTAKPATAAATRVTFVRGCHRLATPALLLACLFAPATTHADSALNVGAGLDHTCALTSSGGVKCWGWNTYGQLGDSATTERLTPVDVSGLAGVTSLATGRLFNCALTSGGGVKCWGYNYYGQLGDGTTTDRPTPVDVSGLTSGVAAISVGRSHACAVTTDGGVKCWGRNLEGQLGDNTTTDRWTPVDVSGLTSGVASVAPAGYHTCAVTTTGGAKCWGHNSAGQLGDGYP